MREKGEFFNHPLFAKLPLVRFYCAEQKMNENTILLLFYLIPTSFFLYFQGSLSSSSIQRLKSILDSTGELLNAILNNKI